MSPTRAEHLAWCKKAALEYLDAGDVTNAVASMCSDLSKHPDTERIGAVMAGLGLLCAMNHDTVGARDWIEGFQ